MLYVKQMSVSGSFAFSSPLKKRSTVTPKGSPKLVYKIVGETANFSQCNIREGSGVVLTERVKNVLLSDNYLTDMMEFPSSEAVEYLDLSGNPIASLRGFPRLPNLKVIKLTNTPLSVISHYRTALLLVAPSLTKIDNLAVTPEERKHAKMFPQECKALVKAGWNGCALVPTAEEIARIRRNIADQCVPGSFRSPKKYYS